jgi:hypothetical protein
MAAVSLSIEIEATPSQVWLALCDPAEVGEWDSGVEAALDAPADYPQPGQHVRWRCRSGFFRILHDRPQEVVREQKLRSLLSLGFVRYDETYLLAPSGAGTSLDVELDVSIWLPLFGWLIRERAVEDARTAFSESLQKLKRHCEAS